MSCNFIAVGTTIYIPRCFLMEGNKKLLEFGVHEHFRLLALLHSWEKYVPSLVLTPWFLAPMEV